MQEPTGEISATPETPAANIITVPEGLITAEQQARVDAALTPTEPVVNEAAQKLAQAKILEHQGEVAQASAVAVEVARTTRESLGLSE